MNIALARNVALSLLIQGLSLCAQEPFSFAVPGETRSMKVEYRSGKLHFTPPRGRQEKLRVHRADGCAYHQVGERQLEFSGRCELLMGTYNLEGKAKQVQGFAFTKQGDAYTLLTTSPLEATADF